MVAELLRQGYWAAQRRRGPLHYLLRPRAGSTVVSPGIYGKIPNNGYVPVPVMTDRKERYFWRCVSYRSIYITHQDFTDILIVIERVITAFSLYKIGIKVAMELIKNIFLRHTIHIHRLRN